MKHKTFHFLAALCCCAIVQTMQGAWNPSDGESIVINKIIKSDDFANTPYEIGECSGIDIISKEKTIPNNPEYQQPYIMYYSSPPIANIKSLFKGDTLKIRQPNIDSSGNCISEDIEDTGAVSFSIVLPKDQPNLMYLINQTKISTVRTTLLLDQLKTYIETKQKTKVPGVDWSDLDTPYLLGSAKPLTSITETWGPTLKSKLPQIEQNAYVSIILGRLIFVEVSLDIAIGFADVTTDFVGFGYIDAVHVRHIEINTPNIYTFLYGSTITPAQFFSSPKVILEQRDHTIPLQELIDNGIVYQTY